MSLALALYSSWSLTLVILGAVPITLLCLSLLSRRIQPHIDEQKTHLERAAHTASSAIAAIETVKAFNGQAREQASFSASIGHAAEALRAQIQLDAFQLAFVRLLTFGMFAQGFWVGDYLVRKGWSTHDGVMTAVWSCLMVTQALDVVMPQTMALEKGRVAGGGLGRLLAGIEKKEGSYTGPGLVPSACHGAIEVTGVS